jgi:hypothetical protein
MLRNEDFLIEKTRFPEGAIFLENLISFFGWFTAKGSHTGRTGIKQKSVEGKAWRGKGVEGKAWRKKDGGESMEGKAWREKRGGKRVKRGRKRMERKAWSGRKDFFLLVGGSFCVLIGDKAVSCSLAGGSLFVLIGGTFFVLAGRSFFVLVGGTL